MNRVIIIATTGLLLHWTSGASARDTRSDAPNLVDEPVVDEFLPFGIAPRPVDPNSPIGLSVKRRSADRLRAQGQLEQPWKKPMPLSQPLRNIRNKLGQKLPSRNRPGVGGDVASFAIGGCRWNGVQRHRLKLPH